MQLLKEKLAYLREHEDFSILYKRPIPRKKSGRLLGGGVVSSDAQGRSVIFNKTLGTRHLLRTCWHQYRLGPCLTDAEISEFERQHDSTLPDEYRRFLMEVGNGGAGPEYGLYKLGERQVQTTLQHFEDSVLIEQLWATAPTKYKSDPSVLSDFQMPTTFSKFLPIANDGCTYQSVLILDGEERGNIWSGDFSGDPTLVPVDKSFGTLPRAPESERKALSFYEWYNLWLDRQIADLHERIMAMG